MWIPDVIPCANLINLCVVAYLTYEIHFLTEVENILQENSVLEEKVEHTKTKLQEQTTLFEVNFPLKYIH